jgi:hypothetical protein
VRWGGAKQLTNSRPIYANAEEYIDAGQHKRKPPKKEEREKNKPNLHPYVVVYIVLLFLKKLKEIIFCFLF